MIIDARVDVKDENGKTIRIHRVRGRMTMDEFMELAENAALEIWAPEAQHRDGRKC